MQFWKILFKIINMLLQVDLHLACATHIQVENGERERGIVVVWIPYHV